MAFASSISKAAKSLSKLSSGSATDHAQAKRSAAMGINLLARAFGSACALYLLLGTAHAQGSVYRCTNTEGKVSYQAQPCAGAGTAQGKEIPLSTRTRPSNTEVRAQPSRPEPRVLEPQRTKPEGKRWGAEADVIVVSGYEFSSSVTQVHITHSARPVLLVLTSYHQTEWKVLPAPGTRIKAVVVGTSDERHSSVKAPPQVPVVVDELPYAYETGNIKFRELMSLLNARYGVERVLGYRGGYKLPEVVPVSGPFVPDPNLTLDGVRPEVPRVRFSFDLISVDGRRLAWTNTGPKDGKRYTGVVRGGTMSSLRGGPAAVREDGSEAYYLEGNGGTLVWAPKGFTGPTQKMTLPANLPELSWGSGMAWNTRKEVLAIVSFGGEGYFYRYDTRNRQWLGARSLQNRDLHGLALNAETGGYVAISERAELVMFNERGEMEEVQPLEKLLPDLDSTYDKGNSRLNSLTVAANGNAVAVINVRNGTVTHIWTYEQGSRKAQLTYKVVE